MATLTLNKASKELNLDAQYVRKLVKNGKLRANKVKVGNITKWLIDEEAIKVFKATPRKSVGKRDDGRNKYTIYLNDAERKDLITRMPQLKDLIRRANQPKSK